MKSAVKRIFIVFSICFSQYIQASTISWSNTDFTAGLADIFTLDIIGLGFTDNVDGGGVSFTFDQTVLNVLSVSIDELVWDFGATGISTGMINNSAGTVDGIMVNTFADVTGDFVVVSVEFQTVGLGITNLSLSEFASNPWASGGSLINPGYVNGSVTVSAVPVPAATWLFGSGLIGLIGVAKRKAHS